MKMRDLMVSIPDPDETGSFFFEFKSNAKLQIQIDSEGVSITGNAEGLEALGKMIYVLSLPEYENYAHSHVRITWDEEIRDGRISFDGPWLKDKADVNLDKIDFTVTKVSEL